MLGARGSLTQIFVVLSSMYLVLRDLTVVEFLPTLMFAALLVVIASNFLVAEILDEIQYLERREIALVLVHLAITIWMSMLYAVLLGLIFSTCIFALDYMRHSGKQ